jgi:predicted  nucleic acid-binding Zn-ribbon protein
MATNLEISAEGEKMTMQEIDDQLIEGFQMIIEDKEKELEQATEKINMLNKKVGDLETELERKNNYCIARENELKADQSKKTTNTKNLKQYQEEIRKLKQQTNMQSKTIANLKKEVLDAKSKSNTGDIIEGYQNELSGLKADIVKYEDSITKYEKREIDLKEQIAALRIELNDQPQKFDETVIPIINTAMESLVSNKLEKFEEAIKKSLREEIQANNTLIEKKLATTPQLLSVENANKPQDTTINRKLWSSVVEENLSRALTTSRNEEIIEQREKVRRGTNLILFNVDEAPDGADVKKHDNNFITNFLKICGVVSQPKDTVRLGARNSNTNRPLKLVMKTMEEKKQVQSRLVNLKEAEVTYRKVSVRDDYTQRERKLVSNMIGQAKERNDNENTNTWKVRGTPENGLHLVKINRRR